MTIAGVRITRRDIVRWLWFTALVVVVETVALLVGSQDWATVLNWTIAWAVATVLLLATAVLRRRGGATPSS